jgi:hypothetical protein
MKKILLALLMGTVVITFLSSVPAIYIASNNPIGVILVITVILWCIHLYADARGWYKKVFFHRS